MPWLQFVLHVTLFPVLKVLYFYHSTVFFCHHLHHRLCYLLTVGAMFVQWSSQQFVRDIFINNNNNNSGKQPYWALHKYLGKY